MKMFKTLVGMCLVAALSNNAWAEYDYCSNENEASMPDSNSIEMPDGSKAEMSDMVATQKAVKQFNADTEAHIACLDEEVKAAGEEITPEQSAEITQRHNDAVVAMEKLAEAFNVEVRAFKKAQADKKDEEK